MAYNHKNGYDDENVDLTEKLETAESATEPVIIGVDPADPTEPVEGYSVGEHSADDEQVSADAVDDDTDGDDDDDPSEEEKTEQGGGYYPTCRFCGRRELPVANYNSQAEADEAATLRCDCYDARQYREEIDRKKRREDNIAKLRQRLDDFSDYVTQRKYELSGELYDFLVNVGINVLDGGMDAATVAFGRFKIKICVGNKSALSLSFSYADAAKTEV